MAKWLEENTAAAQAIRRLGGHMPHALILSGDGDRLAAARYAAAAAVCTAPGQRPCGQCPGCRKVMADIHPDVTTVTEPGRRELSVETVRTVRREVYVRPNEGAARVFLFPDCRALNERDQNVLLKVIEEGPPYAAFFFCAETAEGLLPTVRSRCVELKVRGRDNDSAPLCPRAAELCRCIAKGDAAAVTALLVKWETGRLKREELETVLSDAWRGAAQALVRRCGGSGAVDEAAAVLSQALGRAKLQRLADCLGQYLGQWAYNPGVGHVLGALAVDIETILAR